MTSAEYVLRARSGAWVPLVDRIDDSARLIGFDMTVERDGKPLGGHNVQLVLGHPDQPRHRLDLDVALWLDSGWWVTLRNQFREQPRIATEIIGGLADELSAITAEAAGVVPEGAGALWARLRSMEFRSAGPDYWRH